MITVGSVVMKIAGRDAGRLGVVLDVKDDMVLIDGQVRRREVSVNHVEPVNQTVDIAKNASTESARDALKGIGVEFPEPFANKRERVGGPKPVKQRAGDKKPVKAAKKPSVKKAPAKKSKASAKDEKPTTKAEAKPAKGSTAKKAAPKAKKATPKKSAPKKAPVKKTPSAVKDQPSADETSK